MRQPSFLDAVGMKGFLKADITLLLAYCCLGKENVRGLYKIGKKNVQNLSYIGFPQKQTLRQRCDCREFM